jgi:hypothetical protein
MCDPNILNIGLIFRRHRMSSKRINVLPIIKVTIDLYIQRIGFDSLNLAIDVPASCAGGKSGESHSDTLEAHCEIERSDRRSSVRGRGSRGRCGRSLRECQTCQLFSSAASLYRLIFSSLFSLLTGVAVVGTGVVVVAAGVVVVGAGVDVVGSGVVVVGAGVVVAA